MGATADVGATANAIGTPIALALVALSLVAGALIALRVMRSHRRLTDDLRDARTQAQAIESMLDVWVWSSDAAHRLVAMRPPAMAAAGDWSMPADAPFVWDHFVGDDANAMQARMTSAAPLDDVPVRLATPPSNPPRQGPLRARPHTDAAGRFAGYRGTWRELKAVAPAPLAAQPVASAKPASVATAGATGDDHDAFSFTVSHDLRAPIRVVEGFTKIVKEDYGRLLDRVGNDHLDRVLGAAARMNNMIDALLALSKLSSQPLARQPVNLSQLAGFVADDLRRQSPGREVRLEIEPDMQVQGDPTLLRVVLENLLGNAWKYTGKCAQPEVSFERRPGPVDSFTVRDNGAGFDMRFADRLFGVFQRLHSANDFPGTGVGLASVRRIVRRHGGEIWGEAQVNRGAQFHFTLPAQP